MTYKSISFLIAISGPIAFFFLSTTLNAAENPTSSPEGLKLALATYNVAIGQDSSSQVTMLLHRKGRSTKKRILFTYTKDKGHGERWTLMRFIEPKGVAKTGLLTLDHTGDASDQWLYLPALKRVRRISSTRKGGRFVGSNFYYEDLMDREVNLDHHKIIGNNKVGGLTCIELESIPVKKSNSVYSKRVSCIHPKLLIPLRIDYYKKRGKLVKRLQAKKIKKIQGYWTIFESTMLDLKTGHSSQLITSNIMYDQGLPDSLFSQRGLSDDSQEKVFRPQANIKE